MNSTFEYESYGRGAIKLKLPEMKDKDVQGRHRDQSNYTYNVFISTNKEEFELMESVCYLRTMNNATTNKLLNQNTKILNEKLAILDKIPRFYSECE